MFTMQKTITIIILILITCFFMYCNPQVIQKADANKVIVNDQEETSTSSPTSPSPSTSLSEPLPQFGDQTGGEMSAADFKSHQQVNMVMEGHECITVGYVLTRIAADGTKVSSINGGAKLAEHAKRLIAKAESGDTYMFERMKVRCKGDIARKLLYSMVFKIQ